MAERDYYTDLGLMPYATSAEIKSAFYAAAKQHHPDKSGSADSSAFRQAREAYEKLSDATYRADYDRRHRSGRMNVHGTDDEFVGTRTAAFEAEEAERKASEAKRRPRAASPPPYKPVRKLNQSNPSYYLGKPYLAWQKRQEAWEKRHPEYSSSQ
jgi:DnaJ-class molecular chaperone